MFVSSLTLGKLTEFNSLVLPHVADFSGDGVQERLAEN